MIQPRTPPPPPRFKLGDIARVKNTRFTLFVVHISPDGEELTGASGASYYARQCERVRPVRRPRAA